jgi:ribose transport system ATP-binding protein
MRGIEKRFGATRALRGVHLTVRSGEIHAVMGETAPARAP